jgi:HPr kinase/phosphorylase
VTKATKPVTVAQIVDRMRDHLGLEVVGSSVGLAREVAGPDISSPGLALAGFVNRFAVQRLQVLGETEVSYLAQLPDAERRRQLELFYSFPIPCVFITKAQEAPPGLVETADAAGVALVRSPHKTAEFYRRIKPFLEDIFAPTTTLHGSLADVFGVGLLFQGQSGIGKSECVLDLVERGHRLVADDLVIAKRRGNDVLIGRGHELQRHYMEIRGVGLVDIPGIFGIRAVRQQKRIEVVVWLEEWNADAVVERTGLDAEMTDILGVAVPRIRVPLNPGKNITVIAEVIAMNHLLRYSGIDAAQAFNDRLLDRMRVAAEEGRPVRATPPPVTRTPTDVQHYLREDDE